jgi:hypothetical protein
MSLWIIERDEERVTLTFTHEPLAANPLVQPCGETELSAESDLEAWVFEQAEPWDVVRTPRGAFVRQRTCRADAPWASGDEHASAWNALGVARA